MSSEQFLIYIYIYTGNFIFFFKGNGSFAQSLKFVVQMTDTNMQTHSIVLKTCCCMLAHFSFKACLLLGDGM